MHVINIANPITEKGGAIIHEKENIEADLCGDASGHIKAEISDLDVNRHMNNLRYIEMFQDAYDSSFWREFAPTEMEIRFMSQCKEGEDISICSRVDGSAVHLAALHQDGQIASVAEFRA